VTARSRARFRASFGSQYAELLSGFLPWSGQPCQKQPSTKTASRSRWNTKSGLPGNAEFRRHPAIPFFLKIAASFISVFRFPRDRIADMIDERFDLLKTSAIQRKVNRRICRVKGSRREKGIFEMKFGEFGEEETHRKAHLNPKPASELPFIGHFFVAFYRAEPPSWVVLLVFLSPRLWD
jgi:hypothetical protein